MRAPVGAGAFLVALQEWERFIGGHCIGSCTELAIESERDTWKKRLLE